MTTNDGNSTMDSSTLQSDSPSIDEKARNEAGESLPHDSRSPSPASASKNEGNGNPELTPVTSAKEADAGASNNDGSDDVSANYPTGLRLALITIALCLSVFLMALDNSIIATAIPKITDQFNSLPDVGWYGSAYLLTTASCQLLYGKFYTFFSIKWVYLIGIGIFELGSLLCGVAPSSTALIIGRAVAGVGSAGIFSGALVIVAYTVPLDKRPMYTSFIGAMYGIASVAGPLLGGVFTDKATWRWCFYINLPIGAITVIVIFFFFKSPERATVTHLGWKARLQEFDIYGTAVFMPAIICLLLALQWGGVKYDWSDAKIIALFVVFGILLIAFIGIQLWKQDSATVPPRMMMKRSMWAACWFAFNMGAMFLLLIYYLPIWFQAVKGATAVKSGVMNIPLLLSLIISSVLAGTGVTVLGYYAPFMIASSVVASIGAGLLYTLTPESDHSYWIGYQAFVGIGAGLGMQQPMMAVQVFLNIKDVPVGTSVIVFLQTLGGALFVSVGQNVFSNKLSQGLKKYAPTVDAQKVLNTGATAIQHSLDPADLPGVTKAYNDGLQQTFLVATILATFTILGSLSIEWKSVKNKKVETAAA